MLKNASPKVSIIIPVYNSQAFLDESLSSIRNQTLKEIQIICVDNGSTDGSSAVLEKHAKEDKRIELIKTPRSNAGAARNIGLQRATGEYLFFFDSDDICESDLLELSIKKIETEKSDVLVFSADQFEKTIEEATPMLWSLDEKNLPQKDTFSPEEIKNKLFNSFQNWPWNKIFRADFIKTNAIFFQEIPRTNDMRFVCTALALSKTISVLRKPLIHYRISNKTSLQSTNSETPLSFLIAYAETKYSLEKHGKYKLYEKSFLNWIMAGIVSNYYSLKDEKSKDCALEVFKNSCERVFCFSTHPKNYYNEQVFSEYKRILETPTSSEKRAITLNNKLSDVKNENKRLEQEIIAIRNSKSFKIGLAATALPRKITKIFKKN